MKKFATGAVVLLTVTIAIFVGTSEPRYHGRTLTYWLQQCDGTPLNETQNLQAAQSAVRAIGAKNALPKLLGLVAVTDDPVSLWLIDKTDKFRIRFFRWSSSENYSYADWKRIHWHSAEDFQQLGIAGFEVLGTNAGPAKNFFIKRITLLPPRDVWSLLASPLNRFFAGRSPIRMRASDSGAWMSWRRSPTMSKFTSPV